MRPFLKWAGNKFRVMEDIKKVLPEGKRLIEPFAGSGAVFLNTEYAKYLIAELNPDIINLYLYVQQEGEDFISYTNSLFTTQNNREKKYYQLRELFNNTEDSRLKSALFIYLNQHCYNGLCRYNSKGGYNVPFGHRDNIYFPQKEMLHFYNKSRNATFESADFLKTMKKARKGDVVYCDPPYVPLSKTANFTTYCQHNFGEEQQILLAKTAEGLAAKGITVVISNHDTEFVRDVYNQAEIHELSVFRSISRNPETRQNVAEVLAVFNGES